MIGGWGLWLACRSLGGSVGIPGYYICSEIEVPDPPILQGSGSKGQ